MASSSSTSTMRIGDLAKAAGTTPRTIRHYEELGLLRPAERAASGYRYYGETELVRLRKIGTLQGLGLSLDEIRSVIDLYFEDPTGAAGKRGVLRILRGHLDDARRRRRALERFEAELQENIARVERLLAEAEAASTSPS